jgi:hypothetical protein
LLAEQAQLRGSQFQERNFRRERLNARGSNPFAPGEKVGMRGWSCVSSDDALGREDLLTPLRCPLHKERGRAFAGKQKNFRKERSNAKEKLSATEFNPLLPWGEGWDEGLELR